MKNNTYTSQRNPSFDLSLKFFLLSGKTVQAFPSGLYRVDATFLIESKDIEKARQVFKFGNPLPLAEKIVQGEAPYIFPQPKETFDTPGFCKLAVSAYGTNRSFAENVTVFGAQVVTLSQSFSDTEESPIENEPPLVFNWVVTEKYLVDNATTSGVIRSSEPGPSTGGASNLRFRLISRITSGFPSSKGQRSLGIDWVQETTALSRRNYGVIDEFSLTQTLTPYLT